jgi:hypothetical protein
MKTMLLGGLWLAAAAAHAGQAGPAYEVEFDAVEGPPCISRSLDRANIAQAPVQRSAYAPRVTQFKAVVVAGSGTRSDNLVVAQCAELAKKELGYARSSSNSQLFTDLYGQQVRECIRLRDPRLRVYDVHFVRQDRCGR